MKFLSVCSGIEAASVAWNPLGWQAVGFSEIEKFPSAVLAHHYPDVPNYGDMTGLPERILSGEIKAPDLLCGGTPCQAFSVAGLRQSLSDDRGNLSLTFCEIANAIDTVRQQRGEPESIIFWENVPGVLSTKDNAFGCFLAALAGEDEPLQPPGGRWKNAGVVSGPQRAIAWRVLDAQYFGVAQRRKRVFLVASARDGFNPAEVLLEFDGVRRDSAPSREAGQKVAPTVVQGPPFSRTGNERVECDAIVAMAHGQANAEIKTDGTCPTLTCVHEAPIVQAYSIREDAKANTFSATPLQATNALQAHQPSVQSHHAQTFVAQPIPLDLRNAGRDPEKHDAMNRQGVGVGEEGDPAHTVTTACVHGVAQPLPEPIALQDVSGRDKAQNGKGWSDEGTSYTLDAAATQGVAQPIGCFKSGQGAQARSIGWSEHVAPTLPASDGGNRTPALLQHMAVRRLTVEECEKLQGFPVGYTAIPWRKKPATDCPDGPRYKALGNSWAVPVVRWIGQRIEKAL